MTAFSPVRLSDLPATEMFSLAEPVRAGSTRTSLLGRLWDGLAAAWHREPNLADPNLAAPNLADLGPSQIQELLVMRGRD